MIHLICPVCEEEILLYVSKYGPTKKNFKKHKMAIFTHIRRVHSDIPRWDANRHIGTALDKMEVWRYVGGHQGS